MFGKLEKEEIEDVLIHQLIGRIGCCADNKAYIVPISYAYDGEYVYCHTYEGLKITIMRKNPGVCFEVDTLENLGNWKSVIAWGKFEEVTKDVDRNSAIQKLHNRAIPEVASKTFKLSPQWPFPPDDSEKIKGIIFRIKLEEKTGRFETSDIETFSIHG